MKKEKVTQLINRLNIIFWLLVVLTVTLAFREYQYLSANSPSSGNWVLSDTNTEPNNYLYSWISYVNIVLVVAMGIISVAIYSIKSYFEDKRKKLNT